ncbi:MAG: GxxExxY protein [Candidatus Solibacter sp.]
MATATDLNALTHSILAAAIEVHRGLGPGLLEGSYQEALCYELAVAGISFQREVPLPLHYKNIQLSCGYRLDLLVEGEVIVEAKAVEHLLPVHSAQLLTYLKCAGKHVGLLINFNVPVLKAGIRRMVNDFAEQPL